MKSATSPILFFAALTLLFCGCGPSIYDTAQMRKREYNSSALTITENGLSAAEIYSITQTKPPVKFPVDVAFIVMKDGYVDNAMEQVFVKNIVDSLRRSDKIGRIVPMPKFILPQVLNFAKLQELGIRSLTEYVVVFNVESETFFQMKELHNSKIEIASTIEFLVMDSKTTAIVATDRLYNTIEYEAQVFKSMNRKNAQEQLFSEQGKVFSKIIAGMFNGI